MGGLSTVFLRALVSHSGSSKIRYGEILFCIKFASCSKCIYYKALEDSTFLGPKIAEGHSQGICPFASLCVCKLQPGPVGIDSNWGLHSQVRQRRQSELPKDVLEVREKPLVTQRNSSE